MEAYLGLDDRAAHASRGLTQRTKVIFGPPGHAYVYLIYGMYECLNLVAEPDGQPGCVLIRALEQLAGIEGPTSGPGKLTKALGITRLHNGADVTRGPLTVRRLSSGPAFEMIVTPRIGIRQDADRPLRFLVAGSRLSAGDADRAQDSAMSAGLRQQRQQGFVQPPHFLKRLLRLVPGDPWEIVIAKPDREFRVVHNRGGELFQHRIVRKTEFHQFAKLVCKRILHFLSGESRFQKLLRSLLHVEAYRVQRRLML